VKGYTSLASIQNDISSGKITVSGLVSHYLGVIDSKKHLNAFLEVYTEEALHKAEKLDEKLKKGTAGRLAGMVLALKDNICYKGHHVSASSRILTDFTSLYSATVVERLLAEDVIIIGRVNCDEFAMGASNENSAFGPVLNDADQSKVSGGSSGGAAVAVQAGMCLAALASDTGGSIRQPAAFCGVYGLKPTYGRVSRYGLIAYASSFDQIGPITRSVSDMQLIMEIMAGSDERDATTSTHIVDRYSEPIPEKKYSIGYLKEALEHEGVDEEVKEATWKTIHKLKEQGHEVCEISFDMLDYLVPTYYVLTTAEASSNLSRFSGLMYGHRSPNASDLESTFRLSRTEGFGPEVKRRIMLGTFVLSAGYVDAYYTQAQKVRRLVQQKTNELLQRYDFIISPTTPTPAFGLGEKASNPIAMYLADIFTVHANIAGNPAISFPAAVTQNGLPVGVQLMGRNFEEARLIQLASELSEKPEQH
jgi:aspartyl-tRNA(Asn)/glutamyl-tRNA(Gln) amidotransferase subunit A